MKTHDYLTEFDDVAPTANDVPLPTARAKRVLLILCSTLATTIPAGLALVIGLPWVVIARVLMLTTGPVGCACLLLRPRS
ncbi:MAG: hypothetical protein FWE39_11125 [Nocardiaceae bacterium]|nr:hypothetical protein [Nocardiaceae bacterium]